LNKLNEHINHSMAMTSTENILASGFMEQFLLSFLLIVPFTAFFIIWLIKDGYILRKFSLFAVVLELVISL
jgi:hypothetical protein